MERQGLTAARRTSFELHICHRRLLSTILPPRSIAQTT